MEWSPPTIGIPITSKEHAIHDAWNIARTHRETGWAGVVRLLRSDQGECMESMNGCCRSLQCFSMGARRINWSEPSLRL